MFIPILGEIFEFDEHISQMGCFNHQLVMFFAQLDSQKSFKQINNHTKKKNVELSENMKKAFFQKILEQKTATLLKVLGRTLG